MTSPRMYCALLLSCLLASAVGASRQRRTNVFTLASCMTAKTGTFRPGDATCVVGRMFATYNEMRTARCENCERFFHCVSNSRALNECGNSTEARRAAEGVSDCRQEGDGIGPDYAANQEANRYGRDGGDCAHAYLAAVSCAYNPDAKTCG